MAIKDIDDLTRPLSDLVGEQGEKAARRKKQLAEVRATRAAGMTADEAKAAAERGDFPGVEPSEDIDQDTKPSFFDYVGAYFTDPRLSFIGAGVDLLGRTGAATAPYTENFLKTISQGGDNFIAKAGQFLFEDAANVAAKINAGTSFDELTPFEKLAIASVPAEVIPGLGLAPDILKLGRNFVINLGDDAAKLLDNYMVSKQAVTDTGIIMPIDDKPAEGITSLRVSDEGASGSTKVVDKMPQLDVRAVADESARRKPLDLTKLEVVGNDGVTYVNVYGELVPKEDAILNQSTYLQRGKETIAYFYKKKTGVGTQFSTDQDNFLLRVIRKRLDEGGAYKTIRGSLNEYISESPELLEEAKKLGITDFKNSKLQDRLSFILEGRSGRNKPVLPDENNNLVNEILKFKPLKKNEQTAFFNYIKDNKIINEVLSSDKNKALIKEGKGIDKTTLLRYLDFIRKSSPETQRAVDGKFENFVNEFNLELQDLKNTDSIFYKQYEFFKEFDKTRIEAGKKINPFLNKIFPSKTKNKAKNSLQIAHRFENQQIGKTVEKGLEGTGGTPSAYYLDISKFNQGTQPKLEEKLRIALANNDITALNKLNNELTSLGAEVTVNGVKFGEHRYVEEKLLKELKKYETDPELMKKMGVTREMLDDVYEGLDILSQGAGKLKIKAMAGGGLATIEYMTRPLP